MGGIVEARYGINRQETLNLSKRYYMLDGKENSDCMDSFVLWCSENGYEKGLQLRKRDPKKPHSPENSFFFSTQKQKQEIHEKKVETMAIRSPFCTGCEKECPRKNSGGCEEWKEYFLNNWNQNIHIPPPKPEPVEDPNTPMVFRYEHPDLVREGIVWQQT